MGVSGKSGHGNPFTGASTKLSGTGRVLDELFGVDQHRAVEFEYLYGHIGCAAGKHVVARAVAAAGRTPATPTEKVSVEHLSICLDTVGLEYRHQAVAGLDPVRQNRRQRLEDRPVYVPTGVDPRANRSRESAVDDTAFRRGHTDGLEAPLVNRDFGREQAGQCVKRVAQAVDHRAIDATVVDLRR